MKEKHQELVSSQLKTENLTREIEILEAIIEKYKQKEIIKISLEKKNSELESEIDSLRQENRKIKHGMKVCGFIQKENPHQAQDNFEDDEEENDEYFNRLEEQDRGQERAMMAMAQEHDQEIKTKDQEIRALKEDIENKKTREFYGRPARESKTITFVNEKGTQTNSGEGGVKENVFGEQLGMVSRIQSDLVNEMGTILLGVQEQIQQFGNFRQTHNIDQLLNKFNMDYSFFEEIIPKIISKSVSASDWTLISNSLSKKSISCKSSLTQVQSCLLISLKTLQQNFQDLQIQTDRFAEEVAELSSRNQIINKELDKIMDHLPKSQKVREEELKRVHQELREHQALLKFKCKELEGYEDLKLETKRLKGVEGERKRIEGVLKEIQAKVLPKLKKALNDEKVKAQELDSKIEAMNQIQVKADASKSGSCSNLISISHFEESTHALRNLARNKLENAVSSLSVQSTINTIRGIQKSTSRWYVERVPSYLHQINFHANPKFNIQNRSTQTLYDPNLLEDESQSSKKTEIKQKLNCSESFQQMRTVSTNKDKPSKLLKKQAFPLYSRIINIKKKEKAEICVESPSKLGIVVEALQKQLSNANTQIKDLKRLKKNFKKCRRCLVQNQELLDEEKRKLIIGLKNRREQWRKKRNNDIEVQAFSPEMSKVLFHSKRNGNNMITSKNSEQNHFFYNFHENGQIRQELEKVRSVAASENKVRSEKGVNMVGVRMWTENSIGFNSNAENKRFVTPKDERQVSNNQIENWNEYDQNGKGQKRPNSKSKKKTKQRKQNLDPVEKLKNRIKKCTKRQNEQSKIKSRASSKKDSQRKMGIKLEKYLESKLKSPYNQQKEHTSSIDPQIFPGFMSMPKGFIRHRHRKSVQPNDRHSKEIITLRKGSRSVYTKHKITNSENSSQKVLQTGSNSLTPILKSKSKGKRRKKEIQKKSGSRRHQKSGKDKRSKNSENFPDFFGDSNKNNEFYAFITQHGKEGGKKGKHLTKRKQSGEGKNRLVDSKNSRGSLSRRRKGTVKKEKRKSKSKPKFKMKTNKNLDFRTILDKSQIRNMIKANFKSKDKNEALGI